MNLRKINAVFSLISTLLLWGHAISLAIWMLSRGSIYIPTGLMPWALTVVVAIHAIISVAIMISTHKGHETGAVKQYPKLNPATIVQRITGAMLLLFTALHILGAAGITQTPQVVHAIVPPLFFLLCMAHAAISTSKAFITLGIGDAKFIKTADIAIKAICATTLIADIIGFYLFVC